MRNNTSSHPAKKLFDTFTLLFTAPLDQSATKIDEIKSRPVGDYTVDELIAMTMKKSPEEIHKDLLEMCFRGVELCLKRFPTHYKSHYRLAYIYFHSPYHRVCIQIKLKQHYISSVEGNNIALNWGCFWRKFASRGQADLGVLLPVKILTTLCICSLCMIGGIIVFDRKPKFCRSLLQTAKTSFRMCRCPGWPVYHKWLIS